jgi:hypothetical protein
MSETPKSMQQHETLAQRKERLLLQCRAYRAAVGHSKQVVRDKLSTRAIATAAVGIAGVRAQSAVGNFVDLLDFKNISAVKLQRLLPLLASGYSLLARRSLLKPVFRGAAVVGAAGALVYFFTRKKSATARHEHATRHEHL